MTFLALPVTSRPRRGSFDTRRTGLRTETTVLMQRRGSAGMLAVQGVDTVLALRGERTQHFQYGAGWLAEEHVFVPLDVAVTASTGGRGRRLSARQLQYVPASKMPLSTVRMSVWPQNAIVTSSSL